MNPSLQPPGAKEGAGRAGAEAEVKGAEAAEAAAAAEVPASPFAARVTMALLLVASCLGLAWILVPFYAAILWGVIIATMSSPLYARLLPRLKQRRNLTAALVLMVVLVAGVFPLALLSASLAREATQIYELIDSGAWDPAVYIRGLFDALPAWLGALFDRFGLVDFDTLQRRLVAAAAQGTQAIASQALAIGLDTFDFVMSLFIALYLAFFLVRDGSGLARTVGSAIPLAAVHKRELIAKFVAVVRATIKGSLLVAAIQGALGGLAFWALGVGGALIWGVVMAFLALVPLVGATLVWLPVAAYFLLVGAFWKAGALLVFGALVIGSIDNLLRPMLVGRDTRLPDYVVMITTLGGISVFGINGVVIGPAIAAMFVAVWHIVMEAPPAGKP
ncbi:AI-2E family transporter [Arenimonas sp.]|uniref:AI-2E family transporter n=1 Tax=Arenimonas sp. TaxID=1872635 RepID=UPI0025B82282|nr:AI-2E family transporter [Arenimonas sp.]